MKELYNIEFYITPYGGIEIKEDGLPVRSFSQGGKENLEFVNAFIEVLKNFYPKAYNSLAKLYTTSELNPIAYNYRIVHRFIRCNFGEYDANHIDIDHRGRFQFEEVKCPLRGECKLESVCCKPKFNTLLSERELEVLRLIIDGCTAEDIAEKLFISPHTVNNHRRNIHIKTNTRTIAELVHYWHINNLK